MTSAASSCTQKRLEMVHASIKLRPYKLSTTHDCNRVLQQHQPEAPVGVQYSGSVSFVTRQGARGDASVAPTATDGASQQRKPLIALGEKCHVDLWTSGLSDGAVSVANRSRIVSAGWTLRSPARKYHLHLFSFESGKILCEKNAKLCVIRKSTAFKKCRFRWESFLRISGQRAAALPYRCVSWIAITWALIRFYKRLQGITYAGSVHHVWKFNLEPATEEVAVISCMGALLPERSRLC